MDFRDELKELTPYEPGKPAEELQREYGLDRSPVKLASNENPYPPSEGIRQVYEKTFDKLNRYPDGGSYYLKQAIADHYDWDPSGVTVGAGSDEILDMLAKATLDNESEVIVFEHSFIRHSMVAQIMGANCRQIPLNDDFSPNLNRALENVTEKTDWVCLPNPNNPTSQYLPESELVHFLERLPEDIMVILDEAYFEFMKQSDYPDGFSILNQDNNDNFPEIVVLRTFSKAYGLAGLRIGYGLMNPDVTKELDKVRPPFNVTRPAQELARVALNDQSHVSDCIDRILEERDRLCAELRQRNFEYVPPEANFLLMKPKVRDTGRELYEVLLEEGVIVRPMEGYGLPEYVRVSVGTPEENNQFLHALDEVGT